MNRIPISAVAAAFALAATTALAQTTVTRDWRGREIYTTSRENGTIVIRDNRGREVGTVRRPYAGK